MREIDGYLLTDEEAKACLELVKKMRKKYCADVNCHLTVKAKNGDEAYGIVKSWITDIGEYTDLNWNGVILDFDTVIKYEGVEE